MGWSAEASLTDGKIKEGQHRHPPREHGRDGVLLHAAEEPEGQSREVRAPSAVSLPRILKGRVVAYQLICYQAYVMRRRQAYPDEVRPEGQPARLIQGGEDKKVTCSFGIRELKCIFETAMFARQGPSVLSWEIGMTLPPAGFPAASDEWGACTSQNIGS